MSRAQQSAPAEFDRWGFETPFVRSDAFGADPEAGEPEWFAEPEGFGEPEWFAEPEGFAEREWFAEPEGFAEPEAFGEPEWSSEQETYGEDEAAGTVTFGNGTSLRVTTGATGEGQEHWDPIGPRLPLLDTGPAMQGLRLSRSFTVKELVTSGGRAASVARISPELVVALQALRDRAGRSVRITSGYRSWARNQAVYRARGKKPTLSRHCAGQAADVAIPGLSGVQIAKLAIDAIGPDIGVGVGAGFAHIDVRGTWTLWNYGGVKNWPAVAKELTAYRAARRGGRPPQPVPAPRPTPVRPSTPGSTAGGRAEVATVAALAGHGGAAPAMVLRWNAMSSPSTIDVVVHLHGYSGPGRQMRLPRSVEPISGLDVGDPGNPGAGGRVRPTLLILPRGKSEPTAKRADRFTFPALVKPGAIDALVAEALARFAELTGISAGRGRLILTAHSGGGDPLNRILAHTDPDEVFAYDALYGSPANLIAWMQRRVAAATAQPTAPAPAMRVFFGGSTATQSGVVAKALCAALSQPGAAALAPRFRVERTTVGHNDIPGRFGRRLLADAGTDVGATRIDCGGRGRGEAFVPEAFEEGFDEALDEAEDESWVSTPSIAESDEWEAAGFAQEELEVIHELDADAREAEEQWEEGFEPEEFEPAQFEGFDGEEFEPEEFAAESEDEFAFATGKLEASDLVFESFESFEPEEFESFESFEPEEFEPEEFEGAEFEAEEFDGAAFEAEEFEGEEFEAESAFEGFEPEASAFAFEGFETEGFEPEPEAFDALEPAFEGEGFPSGASLQAATGATGKGQEHWDPHSTGLPLLQTGPPVHATKLSKDFTVKELVTSAGRPAPVARISPALVHLLQAMRDRAGKPLRIGSGYRSWARNNAVYAARGKKATLSRHCSGQAADITIAGMTGTQIAKLAIDVGGPDLGIGVAASFAHVDVRGTWSIWTYLSGDAAARATREVQAHRQARRASPAKPPTPTQQPMPTQPPTQPPGGAKATDRAAGVVRQSKFAGCTGKAQAGAVAMRAQWKRLTGRDAGIYNCRSVRGSTAPSIHGEGRAIDLYAAASDLVQAAQMAAYIAWMQQNAVELQVVYIIWNRRQWSWPRRTAGWRPYGGASPHTDHAHVELSWEGARTASALFAGGVPGLGAGSNPPVPPPKPTPTPSPPTPAPTGQDHTNVKLPPKRFVAVYGPHAKASEATSGVPALVTLAQAALESGWGARAARYNFFGIKARATDPEATRQLWRTREVHSKPDVTYPEVISVTPRPDGRYAYVVKAWFRAYPDAAAAFLAHGRVLRHKRYAKAFTKLPDAYAFAAEVARAGYATDTAAYETELQAVMRTIERAGWKG